MVTITREAIAKAEQFIAACAPRDWFLIISWGKGVADNRRTADGAVAWNIEPDAGWVAELGGWEAGKVPLKDGSPLFGNVRLLVDQHFAPGPFPGGEIYVDGNEFKVRTHAI